MVGSGAAGLPVTGLPERVGAAAVQRSRLWLACHWDTDILIRGEGAPSVNSAREGLEAGGD